jgi:hypothetical protein
MRWRSTSTTIPPEIPITRHSRRAKRSFSAILSGDLEARAKSTAERAPITSCRPAPEASGDYALPTHSSVPSVNRWCFQIGTAAFSA